MRVFHSVGELDGESKSRMKSNFLFRGLTSYVYPKKTLRDGLFMSTQKGLLRVFTRDYAFSEAAFNIPPKSHQISSMAHRFGSNGGTLIWLNS